MQTITAVEIADIHYADFNSARLLAERYGGRYLQSVMATSKALGSKKIGPAFVFWNQPSALAFIIAARELSPHATYRIA